MTADPRVGLVTDLDELQLHYAEPPLGVRANMIFSADGAAAFGGRAGPLSSPIDQQLLASLRSFADVVLVGAGTARAENYGPVRLTAAQRHRRAGEGRDAPPPIAVVSRTGVLPPRLFSDAQQRPILITSAVASRQRDLAADTRWQLLTAGQDCVDIGDAVAQLTALGWPRILCEGGPTLLDDLVDSGCLTEICVTMAPKLASGQPVGNRVRPSALPVPTDMQLEHALVHDDYLFLKYRRPQVMHRP